MTDWVPIGFQKNLYHVKNSSKNQEVIIYWTITVGSYNFIIIFVAQINLTYYCS